MKIMFVLYALVPGGAERVAATLINHWVNTGDELSVVTIASTDTDFYELDSRVKRVALNLARASRNWRDFILNNFQLVMRLRDVIRFVNPDVVLSFIELVNLRVLLAALGTGMPVVVEEHIDPTQHSIGKIAGILRGLLYRRARAVVVLTPGISEWASRIVPREAIHVIPNPIGDQFLKPCPTISEHARKLVGMGRLESQKGFDLLLRAFAQCTTIHSDWTLDIFGEGSERARLQTLADHLGIADRVRLPGVIKDPERVLRQSDFFVLSSRYEGFPMVLLEAMSCGLPVVSFDCHSGPREMIQNGVNGLLVPPNDVDALAKAMAHLMGNEHERKRLGEQATAVAEKFSLAKVTQMWRSLLESIAYQERSKRAQPYEPSEASSSGDA
jgi:GalNAc-alpha-(1->4)-GalNAc-alpha-(1->3)-diNAcBac-PP-undecaprenol alpha-1,4-N-acetyl-D-galactosaminyltransferase